MRKKRILSILLAALMVSGSLPLSTVQVQAEPLLPSDESENIESDFGNEDAETTDAGDDVFHTNYPLTGMPDEEYELQIPEDFSAYDEAISEVASEYGIQSIDNIPSSYTVTGKTVLGEDAGGQNKYVSSVKNQGNWGTCWSFSAMAAAEGAYIKNFGSDDFDASESHLAAFFYNYSDGSGNAVDIDNETSHLSGDYISTGQGERGYTSKVQNGGNPRTSAFALSSWRGAASEENGGAYEYPPVTDGKDKKWDDENLANFTYDTENAIENDVMHMQNSLFLSPSDYAGIKKAVMAYGNVTIMYAHSGNYYRGFSTNAYDGICYYSPYNRDGLSRIDQNSGGHLVTIVGWDDNFSKDYFSPSKPRKNGAWLIKNSWGTNYPGEGFFWMSYENVSNEVVAAYDFERGDNYKYNYQYDGSASSFSYYKNSEYTAAAIYNVSSAQILEAVGVGIASTETDVAVEIYTNLNDSDDPTSGILATTGFAKFSYPGFYTIELDEPAALDKGSDYSIVVTLKGNNSNKMSAFFTDVTTSWGWIEFKADSNNDKTYTLDNDGYWQRPTDYTYRIKGYANDRDDYDPKPYGYINEDMISMEKTFTYTGAEIKPEISVISNNTILEEISDYNVDYSNNIDCGTATATISGDNNYDGQIVKVNFTIEPKALSTDMIETDLSNLQYTTKSAADQIKLSYNGKELSEDDYQISVKSGSAQFTNAGKYTLVISGCGNNYTGSVTVPATIQKANITDYSCTIDTIEYTGKALKPSFTLLGEDSISIPAANYTAAYKNNTKAGTGTLTLTGKGNLQGKLEKDFTILPKGINKDDLKITLAAATYSPKGTPIKATVKYGTLTLKQGVDYNVALKQNEADVTSADIQAGAYSASIDLIGNYTEENDEMAVADSSVAKYKIAASKVITSIDISNKKIVTSIDGKLATEGVDYKVDSIINSATKEEIEDADCTNLEAGVKYDVTISLLGSYDCKKTTKNLVGKINIDDEDTQVTLAATKYAYTGKAIKPVVVKVVANGIELKKTDYTVTYSNNINVGSDSKVIINGKGSYVGEVTADFTIIKAIVKDSDIKYKNSLTFNNKEQVVSIAVGKLKAGTDYTVSDNTKKDAGSYNASLTLSDNYVFEDGEANKSLPFEIKKAVITSVKASNGYLLADEASVTPKVTVKAGTIILADDDYTIEYNNNTALTTSSSKATATLASLVSNNYDLPANEAARTSTFTITKENISKATVSGLSNKVYTGSALMYDKSSDTVSITTSTGTYDVIKNGVVADGFTVTYTNNIKPGKGKIKIAADANSFLAGTKSVDFVIDKANFADCVTYLDKDSFNWPQYVYSGEPIGKKYNIINSAELKESATNAPISASKIKYTYENDTNAGYGKIIITPGSYSTFYTGSITVEFPILKKSVENAFVSYATKVQAPKEWQPDLNIPVKANINYVYINNELVLGRDYTVSYTANTDLGYARFTIAGCGNYTGTKTCYYNIYK